jgi:hypothetical protein
MTRRRIPTVVAGISVTRLRRGGVFLGESERRDSDRTSDDGEWSDDRRMSSREPALRAQLTPHTLVGLERALPSSGAATGVRLTAARAPARLRKTPGQRAEDPVAKPPTILLRTPRGPALTEQALTCANAKTQTLKRNSTTSPSAMT